MGSNMLIDASHPEETRVVVARGNRIEEFDYESASRKQLKGNIYLAKVTRVEPSLQAAFVDYGGNRHGFLAFSEIHPDYYQIPVADRQALLREEEAEARRGDEEDDRDVRRRSRHDSDAPAATEEAQDQPSDAAADMQESESEEEAVEATPQSAEEASSENGEGVETVEEENTSVESVGAEDALEEVPERRRGPRRVYKIQEVIKRRQVILVQVVKEERGNKGAALTTYLSLAGRYCVLMPNTARGGGISRKITDASDRKRLKDVARDIEVPAGMGLIVRTAGAQRTKTEIKRDYDYLLRLWESVRDLTLKSTAPCLVYEEGSLIKRAIRDLYTKDVDDVIVEGDAGYREAKDFMKMLMPSHARNVKPHKDTRPLFSQHRVDSQLDSLFSPTVTLPSGGYLVINQTEALVSIDINSGKATREHNIEDTALKTNLEAADEIARQLRLRDLAGLIVIDFIDMEEKRNNRSVERRLKEALKHDRARIQVGRISHFGLLEMSRQRLRRGMLEGSTRPCPHCQGTGLIRSVSSCSLSVLRTIEEQFTSRKPESVNVQCNPEVAFYILNEKRDHLLDLEATYQVSIFLVANPAVSPWECEIQRVGDRPGTVRKVQPQEGSIKFDSAFVEEEADEAPAADAEAEEAEAASTSEEARGGEDEPRRKRRRRRGRRGGRRNREDEAGGFGQSEQAETAAEAGDDGEEELGAADTDAEPADIEPDMTLEADAPREALPTDEPAAEAEAPKRPRRSRRRKPEAVQAEPKSNGAEVMAEAETAEPSPPQAENVNEATSAEPAPRQEEAPRQWAPPPATARSDGPAKSGWWRKKTSGQPEV
ncbi:MAG: Rne/Rng family ribonuclease [Parvibaculaceae bacterium]